MPKVSAGLLVWRRNPTGELELLLVHPGGPFWAKRDDGAWTIPKGLIEPGEPPLQAALREFGEETGLSAGDGPFVALGEVRQRSGKIVHAWASEADMDVEGLRSNEIEIEFPPRSGRRMLIPEVDRAAYFDGATARTKILPSQSPFIDRLEATIAQS